MISRLFIGAALCFALIAIIARAAQVRIITTNSAAPTGIYRMVTAQLAHGELVLACLPPEPAQLAFQRGYLGAGTCPGGVEPVAKIIGALSGDTVEIQPGWTAINGVHIPRSSTVNHDTMGRSLAHVTWGVRTVRGGEVWLFGFNNPRSWDGRYIGSVPAANVIGRLIPIFTW